MIKKELPIGWKIKLVKDLFEIKKGKKVNLIDEHDESSIPYIVIENLRGNPISNYTSDKNGVLCNPNDLLIVWDGVNCGTVGTGLAGFVGSTIARLRLKNNNLNKDYIAVFLKSKFNILNSNTTGSAIPHLNKDIFLNLEVPIPSIKTQNEIVEIIDKAEKLKKWRSEADELTDKYLRSLFLDMFGNPIKNPNSWKILKLNEVGTLQRGKSKHRPRNAPELLGGEYPLIQTGDVANCKGYIKKYNQTYSKLGFKQSKMWPIGTLCITIAANIAKTGILTFEACFPDSIVGFSPNSKVRTEYVQYWLSFLQKILEKSAPESAQKNINLRILSDLDIPVPPIDLQNKFVEEVYKIERIKENQEQSKYQISNLLNALAQKAFKGELVC